MKILVNLVEPPLPFRAISATGVAGTRNACPPLSLAAVPGNLGARYAVLAGRVRLDSPLDLRGGFGRRQVPRRSHHGTSTPEQRDAQRSRRDRQRRAGTDSTRRPQAP